MCVCTGLGEDNAKFVLLFIVLAVYMLAGAAIFQHLEADLELRQAADFWRVYHTFRRHHLQNGPNAVQRLDELLYAYGNATSSGVINRSRRWDFLGSFHFVATIVSTIGYGNTTPQTVAGKVAAVAYGFFGCSGGILFFNLFLERIITFLAWVLRSVHVHRLRRHIKRNSVSSKRSVRRSSQNEKASLPDILDDDDDNLDLDEWKPSVYWVMLFLSVICCLIACSAAAVYAPLEQWEYFDAVYFCFVSFATIGFGDFVSTQKSSYPHVHWYRVANFVFLLIGCCCTYSLLNVTSIVIKQGLNYIVQRVQCGNRKMAAPHLPRRKSSVSTIYFSRRRGTRIAARESIKEHCETPRRMSGELISMQDFFSANKVSLAVMQKQLQEMAQLQRGGTAPSASGTGLKPDAVGPLAIVSEKFKGRITRKR